MYALIITGPATRDVEAAYEWWKENRSVAQAERWYLGIHAAMHSLRDMPQRCSYAAESDLLTQGIRQYLYGLGRRVTHRIVFALDEDNVVVLRVRHASQDALSLDDLGR